MLARLNSSFTVWVSRLDGEYLQLWLITLLVVLQALIFLVIVPPWQHYDEPAHFRFAWSRVHLPPQTGEELFTPLDPAMIRETLGSMVQYGFYASLPTPNYLRTYGIDTLGLSQSVEFPLYYDILYWPLSGLRFTDITTQLLGSRAVTAFFFLIVVWAAYGCMHCLTPRRHVLRWLVPACIALMGPLADILTAVNNDGAAIAGFTVFLWGSLHALTRRLTWWHAIWILGAMAFTVAAKQALVFTAPLAPLVLVLGFWQRQGWHWRWLWLGVIGMAAAGASLTLRMDSAAFWTTRWLPESQGRIAHAKAVHGKHAMPVRVNYETLYQRLPSHWVRAHPEHLLNFGAWVWSDEPVEVPVLGFAFVVKDAHFMYTHVLENEDEPLTVTPDPQFVAQQFWVPKEAEILYIFLWPYTLVHQDTANHVYYDGIVLVEGTVDTTQVPAYVDGNPRYVRWGEREALNLARNPSGEVAWPNLLPEIDRAMESWAEWNPTSILHRLLDVQWSGRVLWVYQPKFMILNMFNRLAWGGVNLPGTVWGPLTLGWASLALAGCGWRFRDLILGHTPAGTLTHPVVVYGFLATCQLLIWIGADLWIVKFMWMDNLHLSDIRYTFPAIVITVGGLAGGLQYLGSRMAVGRRIMPGVIVGIFAVYNVMAIWAYVDAFPAAT